MDIGCGCLVPRLRRRLHSARAAILKGRGIYGAGRVDSQKVATAGCSLLQRVCGSVSSRPRAKRFTIRATRGAIYLAVRHAHLDPD